MNFSKGLALPRLPCLEDNVPRRESPPAPPEIFLDIRDGNTSNGSSTRAFERAWREGNARFSEEMQALISEHTNMLSCLQSWRERQECFLDAFFPRTSQKPTSPNSNGIGKLQIPGGLKVGHVMEKDYSCNDHTDNVPSDMEALFASAGYSSENTPHTPHSRRGAKIKTHVSDPLDESSRGDAKGIPSLNGSCNGETARINENFEVVRSITKATQMTAKELRQTILEHEADQIAGSFCTQSMLLRPRTFRERFRPLLNGYIFETFVGCIIIANSIFIGLEVEYLINRRERGLPPFLMAVSYSFNFVFFLELIARYYASCGHDFFSESNFHWNVLDTIVVCASGAEAILDIFQDSQHSTYLKHLTNLRILRILRVVRLARVLRISRVLRLFKALRSLVYSITCTLRSLFWAMVLLAVIIYCFGVVFTQSAAEYLIQAKNDPNSLDDGGSHVAEVHKFWGSLFISMRTLFQAIAGGVSWIEPLTVLDHVQLPLVSNFLFGLYIAFTYFAVLNVVTGVFCTNAIESASRDNETMINNMMQNRRHYCKHIAILFQSIDEDASGHITLAEFEARFRDPEVQAYFESLDLNADDALEFFKLLDTDDGGYLDLEEFVDGCLRMRGPARSVDVLRMMHEQRKVVKLLSHLSLKAGLTVSRASVSPKPLSPRGVSPLQTHA